LSIWEYKILEKTGNYQQSLSKPCVIGKSDNSHPPENRTIRLSSNSPIGKEEIEIAVEGINNFALLNQ